MTEPKVAAEAWPMWQRPAAAIGMVGLAFSMFALVDVDRPALYGVFLLAAISPWLVEALLRCDIPAPVFVLTVAAMVVLHPVGQAIGVVDRSGESQASLFVLVWAVGELAATRRLVVLGLMVVAAFAIIIVAAFVGPGYGSASATIWCGAVLFALFSGLLMRRLATSMTELHAAQAELARKAATEERQRIAREVHDVIAHSMTVTMLHLTAARMAVGRGDAGAATEALEEAERAGRASLADIRATVGLLRVDEQDVGHHTVATSSAAPGAADLTWLVADYRSAGLRVDASFDEGLAGLAPAVGLVVYRVVQEALANVAKHAAGAAARVAVRVGRDVEIEISDDGGPPTAAMQPGHGVLGMRERAASLGGRLEAGPSPTGWRVRATIPTR